MNQKRGAPVGNSNARKHGFYSAAFKTVEARLRSEVPAYDLSAEIELIRVTTLRLLQAMSESSESKDLATQLTVLRALNLSAHSIASLLRVQARAADAREVAADLQSLLESEADWDAPAVPHPVAPQRQDGTA